MASVKLAGLQAQMDLMSFKKQDSFGTDDPDCGAPGSSGASAGGSKHHHHHQQQSQADASIKGLWRRAFNSLKTKEKDKVSRTSKKKKTVRDEEETMPDVDPVYSLLKRAADKGVPKCTGCSGPGTSARTSDASLLSMSPASMSSCTDPACTCLCHRPHLIPCITLNDLKPQPKHPKLRSKSVAAAAAAAGAACDSLTECPELECQQQRDPVWGGRGRISSVFETLTSRQHHHQHQHHHHQFHAHLLDKQQPASLPEFSPGGGQQLK